MLQILEGSTYKSCQSPNYNYFFRKKDGVFLEWGATKDEDPTHAPFPNLVDLEISKVVDENFIVDKNKYNVVDKGCNGCEFCYKLANKGQKTISMKTKTFDTLMSKLNKNRGICQCAIGINQISTCPDFWNIIKNCRNKHSVVPNYTTRGEDLTERDYKNTAKHCGAVAISYSDRDTTYNTVQKFIFHGTKQTNIHYMISHETLNKCYKVMDNCRSDKRLRNLNALVLLMFKNKTTNTFTTITDVKIYKKLIDYAKKLKIPLGFDSCSAYNYLRAIQGEENYETQSQYVTSCCAARSSSYINIFGEYHACSFLEGREEWGGGLNVLEADDFIRDIWNHPQTVKFREKNIRCSREMSNPCKYFDKTQ